MPHETLDGWYRRIENNGWRPVSNKHLHQMNMDYYYGVEKSDKPIEVFPASRLVRRQDQELKRKKKKIEWMNKMYKNGMLKSKSDDEEQNMLVNEAAKNILSTIESQSIECVEDWEVDQLLDWTNTLSYNE